MRPAILGVIVAVGAAIAFFAGAHYDLLEEPSEGEALEDAIDQAAPGLRERLREAGLAE